MKRGARRLSSLGAAALLLVSLPAGLRADAVSCETHHSVHPKEIRLRFDEASEQKLGRDIAVRLERYAEELSTTAKVSLGDERFAWEAKFQSVALTWEDATHLVPYFRRAMDGGKVVDFSVLEDYECRWLYLPETGACIGDFFVHLQQVMLEVQVAGKGSDWVVQGLGFAPSPSRLRDRMDELTIIPSSNCGIRLAVDGGEPVVLRLGANFHGKTIPLKVEVKRSRLRAEGGAPLTRDDFVTDRSSRRSGATAQQEDLIARMAEQLLARDPNLRIVEVAVEEGR